MPAPVNPVVDPYPDPVGLVNLWHVEGVGADDVWLRLADRELTVWAECGIAGGAWRAATALFVADVQQGYGSAGCMSDPAAELDWLYAATSFEAGETPETWNLLDTDGDVVATLRVDGAPPASEDLSDDYLLPPVVTQATRDSFGSGSYLVAQSDFRNQIEGRWTASTAFVEFSADGSWTGSDGCNAATGRWVRDDTHFLATSGASTLMGCDSVAVPTWVATAAFATISGDGDMLEFVGPDGAHLGTVAR